MNPAFLMMAPSAAVTSLGIVLTAGQRNVHSANPDHSHRSVAGARGSLRRAV